MLDCIVRGYATSLDQTRLGTRTMSGNSLSYNGCDECVLLEMRRSRNRRSHREDIRRDPLETYDKTRRIL